MPTRIWKRYIARDRQEVWAWKCGLDIVTFPKRMFVDEPGALTDVQVADLRATYLRHAQRARFA